MLTQSNRNPALVAPSEHRAQWVVRAVREGKREYSTSPAIVLFQLTERTADAHRFDRYEDASAHARHLSFVYRLPFEAVARVPVVHRKNVAE